MNTRQRKVFQDALKNIAGGIIEKAHKDSDGIYWETPELGNDYRISYNNNPGIYSGDSGIILFFLELYKFDRNPCYLAVINESLERVVRRSFGKQTSPLDYSFFSGRLGVVFILLEYYKNVIPDRQYLKKALQLTHHCLKRVKPNAPNLIYDFNNGLAGALICLLHLFHYTGNKDILKKINGIVDLFISKMRLYKKGICWNSGPGNIKPLCGLSHGGSGIGYAFLELGRYFNNRLFTWVAQQAFAYERYHFDKSNLEYPDFRKPLHNLRTIERYKAEYRQGNFQSLLAPEYTTAWCHGSTGIGLIRMRAFETLRTDQYKTEIRNSIKRHDYVLQKEDPMRSFTLCHGHGGFGLFYLECFKYFRKKSYYQSALDIGLAALKQVDSNKKYISGYTQLSSFQDDLSLLTGDAGIGYFFLKLLRPDSITENILRPDSPSRNMRFHGKSNALSKKVLQRKILSGLFPQTHRLIAPSEIFSQKKLSAARTITLLEKRIIGETKKVELWYCEKNMIKMQIAVQSNALQYIRRNCELEKNSQLNEMATHKFLDEKFIIPREDRLIKISLKRRGRRKVSSSHYYLLASFDGMYAIKVDNFSYELLSGFRKCSQARKVVARVRHLLGSRAGNNSDVMLVDRLKEFLKIGMLYRQN